MTCSQHAKTIQDEIMRDAKAVHLRRPTIMNHENIVEKRNAEIRINCLAKLHTMDEDNAKHNLKVSANRDAACKLLKKADDRGCLERGAQLSDESNIEVCCLDTFGSLTKPEGIYCCS